MADTYVIEWFYYGVRTWLPPWPDPAPDPAPDPEPVKTYPPPDEYWMDFFDARYSSSTYPYNQYHDIMRDGVDPFIPDLVDFFTNAKSWVLEKWGQLGSYSSSLNVFVEYLWGAINAQLSASLREVRDEIVAVVNYISNIATIFSYRFYDDLGKFATDLMWPLTQWLSSLSNLIANWAQIVWNAFLDIFTAPLESIYDILYDLDLWIDKISDEIWDAVLGAADSVGAYIGKYVTLIKDEITLWLSEIYLEISKLVQKPIDFAKGIFNEITGALADVKDMLWSSSVEKARQMTIDLKEWASSFDKSLNDALLAALKWIWDEIKETAIITADELLLPAWEATKGALGWLKDEFVNLVGLAYNEIYDKATSLVPVTPERSGLIAAGMFGSAVGFGVLAHSMALAVEVVPNLKYMGVHYLSAFVARMGSFGTISTATMGVIAALAIKVPFTYYMNSILRSTIPDDKLLIEFRAKRDVTKSEFTNLMKYHGYSNEWIDTIDSWLWKDPRLFEILYCADVTVPPTEWLQRKFERAGYEDSDIGTLIKVVERRTTRSPRTYYSSAMRRNYRHGFMTEDEMVEGIHALELAEDAVDWIKRAGELDNIYEEGTEWITIYKTSYRNDVITESEMRASLSAMGLPASRVDAISELEYVRKLPRVLARERKEIETEWNEIQEEYSRVYIESFRKGLITESALAAYLSAIGINPKVSSMTARHEAVKKLPKPKPEAIEAPFLPPPVKAPVYE
jgi:hypothetical protein